MSACVTVGISASGSTLLLNPVGRTPVAITQLNGALTRGDTVVMETVWTDPDTGGLPHLQLMEKLPGFWAQPGSLVHFLKGPTAYSGRGIEAGTRDWAGMQATDQRAYRLDPGLKARATEASTTPRGGGVLSLQSVSKTVAVTWSGVAGRVYEVQATTELGKPFVAVGTLICMLDGLVRLTMPFTEAQAFYRVAEIVP